MTLEVFLRRLCNASSYLGTDPEDERSDEEETIVPQVLNQQGVHRRAVADVQIVNH